MNTALEIYPRPISARRLITPKNVAERLAIALTGRGIEKHGMGSELARVCGVSPQAAATWLQGKVMPNYANMLRICYAYGIDVGWMMEGKGAMYVSDGLEYVQQAWVKADTKGRNILETVARQIIEN